MYCMHERGKKKVEGCLLLLQVQQRTLYFFVITMGILVLGRLLIGFYFFLSYNYGQGASTFSLSLN
jgi:hypothetical protein